MNELRNRGVEDILIAVVDGLKGFPEAITTVFPLASVQTCIVHLSRYCLSFCGWKERQTVARELKTIYRQRITSEKTSASAPTASEGKDSGGWIWRLSTAYADPGNGLSTAIHSHLAIHSIW